MGGERLPKVECACRSCVSNCRHIPGWYLPDEIGPAAAAADLTPREFFARRCTLDFWAGEPPVFTVRPRVKGEPGGQMSEFVPPTGRACAHLEKDRCAVHATKPYECAVTRHDIDPGTLHADVAQAWRSREAQALVVELYGSVPVAPEPDEADVFELMFAGLRLR